MYDINTEEIQNRFGYHSATSESIEKHKVIRGKFIELAATLNDVLPMSREKSCFFTALQEASMWANASVACNETPLTLNQ